MADSDPQSRAKIRGVYAVALLCLWALAIFGLLGASLSKPVFALGAVLLASALLGSIPWGVIISRVFFHTDIREHGSGNIGTTNAMRTMGKKGGVAVFVLDFGKGIASGALALWVLGAFVPGAGLDPALTFPTQDQTLSTAFLGCVLGHIFSPWLDFKGGKGIAVAIGCLFITFGIVPSLIEIAIFAVLVLASRYVSLGSVACALACPFIALYCFWGDVLSIVLCTIAGLTVVWAHRGNIARLRAGNERRIGDKKKAS